LNSRAIFKKDIFHKIQNGPLKWDLMVKSVVPVKIKNLKILLKRVFMEPA